MAASELPAATAPAPSAAAHTSTASPAERPVERTVTEQSATATLARGVSISEDGAAKEGRSVGSSPSTQGAPVMRRPSLSQHPLFAAKARGLRTRIMRFTPSWFSVTMGTGIVNTLLFDLPWEATHPAFRGIGAAFLVFDMGLFVAFTIISITRYALFPKIFLVMLAHETHSLFLGTIPMGFVTITSGIARTGTEYGIEKALDGALVMWWIALVMSVFTAFGVPFIMFTKHNHTAEALTAAWLLPVVPPITIAAVGSSLCRLLIERDRLDYAFTILVASYVMNGVGLLIACGLMVIYFQRLAVHHLPPRELIVSTFLPLGPCGQGGFALIELGRIALDLLPKLAALHPHRTEMQELSQLGPALLGSGLMSGMLLWGLGIWWMFVAVVSVGSHYIGKTVAFNMGWWAFTFPLGSLNLLTYSLGNLFNSMFFNVVGAMMTFCVVALWTIVFIPTVTGFFRGTLFPAPCLAALPPAYVDRLPGGQTPP
ncbi:voltage-dependent anion channel-domain-containing protein [Leucosporidium creatinivorum]|uniref:Voltage-dependent anion channel-domain-containing protein n=1 Tax=Leucosporidium creatinivorum TaxID=106004 RepID=A0A1Y2ENT3_9BASI|nr:voltage-dependent anion channel-domain-containing protein [Leucosporidium creatinivorum]